MSASLSSGFAPADAHVYLDILIGQNKIKL